MTPDSQTPADDGQKETDPAYDAAMAHAKTHKCCASPEWRGKLCLYHQGFEDGYDAALDRGICESCGAPAEVTLPDGSRWCASCDTAFRREEA